MTDIDATSGRPVATTNVHILYAMHLVAPFTLWSLSLLAVIIGAFVRDPVRGTYVETHISWLLRTFCWGILWLVIGTTIFVLSVVGIFLLWALWGILTIWYIYRVVRGWLRLNDHHPAPE
jgi:uncharacterized membrane protein